MSPHEFGHVLDWVLNVGSCNSYPSLRLHQFRWYKSAVDVCHALLLMAYQLFSSLRKTPALAKDSSSILSLPAMLSNNDQACVPHNVFLTSLPFVFSLPPLLVSKASQCGLVGRGVSQSAYKVAGQFWTLSHFSVRKLSTMRERHHMRHFFFLFHPFASPYYLDM